MPLEVGLRLQEQAVELLDRLGQAGQAQVERTQSDTDQVKRRGQGSLPGTARRGGYQIEDGGDVVHGRLGVEQGELQVLAAVDPGPGDDGLAGGEQRLAGVQVGAVDLLGEAPAAGT